VELAMTPAEVKKIVGNPRSIDSYKPSWNYGGAWFIFEGGIVIA